ncbi:MAG: DUF1801 domain-containing protein, partial [Flavobacterium sp.]
VIFVVINQKENMTSTAATPEVYLQQRPTDRLEVMQRLRQCIIENLPEGFQETMQYGMLSYVVPFDIYPSGYHCAKDQPLPFLAVASQKNAISLYHMGIYAEESLLQWFVSEYPNHCKTKLDMGKSCIRFKKMDDIPWALIAELCQKMTPAQWVLLYENNLKK